MQLDSTVPYQGWRDCFQAGQFVPKHERLEPSTRNYFPAQRVLSLHQQVRKESRQALQLCPSTVPSTNPKQIARQRDG